MKITAPVLEKELATSCVECGVPCDLTYRFPCHLFPFFLGGGSLIHTFPCLLNKSVGALLISAERHYVMDVVSLMTRQGLHDIAKGTQELIRLRKSAQQHNNYFLQQVLIFSFL
jgi:hypothetical protein